MILLIYAIVAGASAVAGEEERHTLDLLLANPISRGRVVLEKLAAMTVGVVLLAAVTGGGAAGRGPVRRPAAAGRQRRRRDGPPGPARDGLRHSGPRPRGRHGTAALSRAVPAVVAVAAYVVNGLAPLVSWLEPLQKFSPFYQYGGHDPLRTGISASGVLVAVATVLALTALAVAGLRRRDVAA